MARISRSLSDKTANELRRSNVNWYIKVLKKYAVFSGRARRKEYWMFVLFNFIFSLVTFLLDLVIFVTGLLGFGPLFVIGFLGFGLLSAVYSLAVLVPGLAVSVRRLHDVGKSGWYLLINLIPIAGPIWFLVLTCLDSQAGDNKYGPNPKEESDNSVTDYSKAIELAPDSADACYKRGDAYDQMGEYGKAIADYNKAIELNPNNSLTYYNRGLAYSKRGEVPKAVGDLEKCISLSTDPKLTKDAKQVLFEIENSPSKG